MNAMIGTPEQKQQFGERLTRISRGGVNTSRHIYVGPVDEALGDKAGKPKRLSRADLRRLKVEPVTFGLIFSQFFMVPFALAVGAACVVAGRAVETRFVTPEVVAEYTEAIPFLTPYGIYFDLLLAAGLASLIGPRLGLRKHRLGRAQFAGFAAMLLFEGAAVTQYPQVFDRIYSAEYVAEVSDAFTRA